MSPVRRRRRVGIVGLIVAGVVVAGCTFGADGEGARYTGRVSRISGKLLCVGPNTSSPTETCAGLPAGFRDVPVVGQCVALFAHIGDAGTPQTWTVDSLRLKVADSKCSKVG
jgi:hypothetical protein